LVDDALAGSQLGRDDVAINASSLLLAVTGNASNFLVDSRWEHQDAEQLRVWVFERRASFFAVIVDQKQVLYQRVSGVCSIAVNPRADRPIDLVD
jgi:hypothetical protein